MNGVWEDKGLYYSLTTMNIIKKYSSESNFKQWYFPQKVNLILTNNNKTKIWKITTLPLLEMVLSLNMWINSYTNWSKLEI